MVNRNFINLLFALGCIFSFGLQGFAQTYKFDEHIKVALRMIGHEILLNSDDSTSRILPIEKEATHYKIQFEKTFQFDPGDLVSTIDGIVDETKIANHYLVEVKDFKTEQVVYSYEKGNSNYSTIVPCQGRIQPEGFYAILFTVLDSTPPILASYSEIKSQAPLPLIRSKRPKYFTFSLLGISLILLLSFFLFARKKGRITRFNSNLISLGEYKFDKQNMQLLRQHEKIELTGKEAELLFLLYSNANTTLEKTIILKNVWGDDGYYIGRTLDVYISKLRKKLESDTNLKIVNIRGVGYKLIMNM